MIREEMIRRVKARKKLWDIIVIGGGATGVGCALDAASRGFAVLLLEKSDFGKETSSRSTKLVHGGVRYLAQGDVRLVKEALKERGLLKKNAPHLVDIQSFIVPCYSRRQKIYYGAGLKMYNLLSAKYGFGKSRILSKRETLERMPGIKSERLRGGVLYFDGQFNDTRLLIDLVKTAAEQTATVLNYAEVFNLTKNENKIDGVEFRDAETGEEFVAKAKIVINATGAFCDSIRRLSNENAGKMIAPSQGVHLVFDRKFLPADDALMIPKTSDNRVLFLIPWLGKTLAGTTDTPIEKAESEPQALEQEIEFIIQTAGDYLAEPPTRDDVKSVFAGVRPLVESAPAKNTARLSRDHTIEIDEANLLTVTGGKWTTYRRMAEDAIDATIEKSDLSKSLCVTATLKIHGFCETSDQFGDLAIYGAEAEGILKLIAENPHLAEKLHADLPYCAAEIVWATRFEMAQTLEDALARRTRILFLDAKAAIEIAPKAAEIMAAETGRDQAWIDKQIEEFTALAQRYLLF